MNDVASIKNAEVKYVLPIYLDSDKLQLAGKFLQICFCYLRTFFERMLFHYSDPLQNVTTLILKNLRRVIAQHKCHVKTMTSFKQS